MITILNKLLEVAINDDDSTIVLFGKSEVTNIRELVNGDLRGTVISSKSGRKITPIRVIIKVEDGRLRLICNGSRAVLTLSYFEFSELKFK